MNILMVTGSLPPEACGVGGYTARLVEELRSQGSHVDILHEGPWGLSNAWRLNRKINTFKPNLVHIQYPTVGFDRALGPQMLSLLQKRVVVTIHEVSQVHWLRRLSLYPFSFRSKALLFSNQYDCDYAAHFAPWIHGKTHIVPLGSSLPKISTHTKDPYDVVCFGLIRPQKGIEDFIEAAAESQRRYLPFRFTLVGMKDPRFEDYFNSLVEKTKSLPVHWDIGLDNEATAARLSRATYAYMPFPDGATERRTSLLALLAQGIAVVTTETSMTPHAFKSQLMLASNPGAAVDHIQRMSRDPSLLARTVQQGTALAKSYEWPSIAARHIEIYDSILRNA